MDNRMSVYPLLVPVVCRECMNGMKWRFHKVDGFPEKDSYVANCCNTLYEAEAWVFVEVNRGA